MNAIPIKRYKLFYSPTAVNSTVFGGGAHFHRIKTEGNRYAPTMKTLKTIEMYICIMVAVWKLLNAPHAKL